MLLDKLSAVTFPIPQNRNEFPGYLDKLAEFIFKKLILKNGNETFRFCEIEFYICSADHLDLFSHQKPQQIEFGLWYFHESGLDITFGDQVSFASFLIRGIRREDSGRRERFISGPLNVLKTLCNSTQTIDQGKINILVEYSDNLPKTSWIKHERIGLNIQKELDCKKDVGDFTDENLFYNSHYRFISWLEPSHGFRNRNRVLEDAFNSGADKDRIQEAFSYTPKFLK